MLSKSTPLTTNRGLLDWVSEKAALFQAEQVHWCDGSDAEYQALCDLMVQSGSAVRLNQSLRPNSLLVRTDSRDASDCSHFIAEHTFLCTRREVDAGPTNNWHDPLAMKQRFNRLFAGAMRGRTLFVVPFALGPRDSTFERIGVQLTDSPYVAANLRILTRMGQEALEALGDGDFAPCLHSLGYPLLPGESDVPWPCDPDNFLLAHFPEERQVWSYGSGYGDNALLSRKSFGLRLAGAMARDEGWLAEHMLLLGLSNPQGRKIYVAGAFPPG
ncbi:MAG TPA: phosphoenolpyruvate carboxykinase domain-containing protein, partial [Abditibacteriaceae bacterium]